ncbi:MAG: metallophosphoesterase [Nitrospinales bacterium]
MTKQIAYPLPEFTDDFLSYRYGYRVLRLISIFVLVLAVLLTGTANGQDFTIIVLPDTQNYSDYFPEIFQAQTKWIADNKDTLNIVYVAHVGDIVNHSDDESEWINADNAMSQLDAAMIPYGVVPGNHDEPTTFYNQYFGVNRFCNTYPTDCRSYYGDGYPAGRNDNNYTLFSASGMDFIVIDLEWLSPAAGVLNWAKQLLEDNRDRRAIVVSHYILKKDATFGPWGQQIYSALMDNPNLFLMLCGHAHNEARRMDGALHTLLADYQEYPNAGNGFLRILHFLPEENEIRVESYSPWLNQYETDPNSQFALSYDMESSGARNITADDGRSFSSVGGCFIDTLGY